MRTVVFHLYYKHIVTKMEGGCSLDAYGERVQGLPPKVSYHQKESKLPPDFPELLEEATALRRECPSHSVNDIIRILELEEKVTPGILCRSTLQRHMQARGHPFRTGHGMSGSKIRYFSLSVVLYAAFTDYTNVERRNKELDQKKIGSFSKCSAKKKGLPRSS